MKLWLKYGRLMLAGLFLIGFAFNPPAQAADPPFSFDQYWQKMRETQALLAGLKDAPVEAQKAQLATLAGQWQHVTRVIGPNGVTVAIDPSFLVAQLQSNPPDLTRLNNLLAALLDARSGWPPAKHSPQDADVFRAILARPEFQWQAPPPSPLTEWWQEIQRRFWHFIISLLPERGVISADSGLIRYGLTGLALVLLLTVLTLTLRGLLADFVTEAEAKLNPESGDELLSADAAFKRAQSLSGAGDYRTAVRYLYLSSLLLLEERGLLRYDRSQTNREYLRHVAHLPQLATTLREVIEVFDRVWYGYQPLDEAAYSQYAAQVLKLRQQK